MRAGDDCSVAPAGRVRWDRLTISVAAAYCLMVVSLSAGVVLGELRSEFHLSGVVAALHTSTFGIGLLIVAYRGVDFVDRVGRRAALAVAICCLTVGGALFATGPAWPITLAGAAIAGPGGALLVLVLPGVVHDHHGERATPAFAAVNGVPVVIGTVFCLGIGASLARSWSWRVPYLAFLVVAAAAVIGVGGTVTFPEAERHTAFSWSALFRKPMLRPWLFMVNAILAEFSIAIWGVAYLDEVAGASAAAAPVLASGFGAGMFASRMVLGRIEQRLGPRTIGLSFALVSGASCWMCVGPGLWTRVVALGLVGLGAGLLYPLCVARLFATAPPGLDTVAMGAYAALASGVAVTVGPLLLGALADAVGLRWAPLSVTAIAAVGAVTQWPHAVAPATAAAAAAANTPGAATATAPRS